MDLLGIIILALACVVLYIVIFKWNWLLRLRYRKSLYDLIIFKWGEKGVRITTGVIAILIIWSGIVNIIKNGF